jgi:hypothetical protein
MSANNLQTNRNATRYFFATAEASGDQTLGLQYGTTGGSPNLSTMAVIISGAGGNGVIVNTAPSYQATDYIFAEEGIGAYGSTYFTPSTLATTISGINLTSDRANGSGIACIESYGGNGSFGGFEFLSRGVNSALLSTPMDALISSIGRPGATAVLGGSGTMVVNTVTSAVQNAPLNNPSDYSATLQLYPCKSTNEEFGTEGGVEIIAGATSNQALFGQTYSPLFSTPMVGLNPNGQTFVSINWANGLSTGSNHVNFKMGFSTATAYTNILTTSYVPGSGGTWTPSDLPSATSPIGHTLVTACIDPDGVAPDGTGVLYVLGQLSDPAAPADQLFIAKGLTSETTRNALVWRPI